MTKAVMYCRVSGMSQIDGEGWTRQQDTIQAYAAAHDIEIVGVYEEKAVPGKTEAADRPALMEMLADLLSNGCRTIIVERLDRLAREYRVQEELLLYLTRKDLTLISADTGENITEAIAADPMRRFVVQLQGLLAELDKNLTVAKLKKARASKRSKGGFAGGNRPYGYCSERATLEELQAAAMEREIRDAIQRWRNAGETFEEIRRNLNQHGWKPRSGKTWHLSSIRAIALKQGS